MNFRWSFGEEGFLTTTHVTSKKLGHPSMGPIEGYIAICGSPMIVMDIPKR